MLDRPRRRPRDLLAGAFAKYHAEGVVTEVEEVTATMRHIRFVADEPIGLPYTPGQHVRVQINDPFSLYGLLRPVETLRTYSIWDYSPARRAIDLRVHLYEGDGIGVRWAREARVGDPLTFWGPQGDFVTRAAPYHLFVGEETASVAFGPMIRGLTPGQPVYGVLESEDAGDEPPCPGGLHRVYRRGASPVSSRVLLDALAALDLPDEPGAAYLAGEARTCQSARDHLVRDRGWPRTSIKVKPFWTPDKRGLH
ncbi:siderophore-interacting protein [Spongiactinospora rosea]|uniref:Siderophore-interacting protein n=1 Tax=Spongiactinospora rosea TaxID=2248750 RepID=A0A366LN18_9ACTN|nr:siderophore-interacting protein [Spongiactinospora rosea]RBQ15040.1 siderophore-interacting protein [Spongiactinospora rosea]